MKKIFLVLSLVVVFFGLGLNVNANTIEPSYVSEVKNHVNEANAKIEALVAVAQQDALVLKQTLPNSEYNAALKVLVQKLVNDTNTIAQETFDYAAANGVVVKCEYVTYTIGNRNVKIDPIIVVGWGADSPNP